MLAWSPGGSTRIFHPRRLTTLAGPLIVARHVQELIRQLALRAAEQRLAEHMANQADDAFGGN